MKKISVISELRKEFAVPIERMTSSLGGFFKTYPRAVFFAMTLLMLSSALLCFTFLRVDEKKASQERKAVAKVSTGLSEMVGAAARLQRVLEIQGSLKALLAKDTLNASDSLAMSAMIKEIETLSRTQN